MTLCLVVGLALVFVRISEESCGESYVMVVLSFYWLLIVVVFLDFLLLVLLANHFLVFESEVLSASVARAHDDDLLGVRILE